MRYYTSDLHFGHENIIRFCDRPYLDVAQMDEAMVVAWNAQVSPEDEVVILGDLVLGKFLDSLAVASLLNGTRYLLPGNHDRCWTGRPKRPADPQPYLDAGFIILDDPDPVTLAGQRTLLSHFPYRPAQRRTDDHNAKYWDHQLRDTGEWLLHGHVHDLYRQRGRQINVGIDAWGGRLVPEAELEDLIAAGPADRESIRWHA
jgi:calcineurin-like phosphoesterase family protein